MPTETITVQDVAAASWGLDRLRTAEPSGVYAAVLTPSATIITKMATGFQCDMCNKWFHCACWFVRMDS